MTIEELKKNTFFKLITNKYVVIFLAFLIWMLFFDTNSYLTHRKFNNEIKDLKETIEFYEVKIKEEPTWGGLREKKRKRDSQKIEDGCDLTGSSPEKLVATKDAKGNQVNAIDLP